MRNLELFFETRSIELARTGFEAIRISLRTPERLLQTLSHSATNGHRFTYGLHLGAEHWLCGRKFLEGKPGHLGDHIVYRWLKARRSGLGNVIRELVEPEELDQLQRKQMQLEVEKTALEKETDDASASRLETVEREIAELRAGADAMKARWENEKQAIGEVRALKERRETLTAELERAKRQHDLERAAQIQHGELVALEGELAEREQALEAIQQEGPLLSEEVTAEEIAEIVSKWTGIPVAKMLESEQEKLLTMEDQLRRSVIGQDDALRAVSAAVRRARASPAA